MTKQISTCGIDFIFEGESLSRDNILLSPHLGTDLYSRAIILDYQGNVLKSKVLDRGFATDFKQIITKEGNIFYSYNKGLGKFKPGNGWYERCMLELLDEKLNPIKTISAIPYGSVTADDTLQCHDSLIIDENHWYGLINVVSALEVPGKSKPAKVINCIIQEVINNKVVWQFESLDYPELFELSIFHNELSTFTAADYAHLNAIAETADKKYLLLSYRNIGIVKIEKETKKIVWVFGKKSNQIMTPSDFTLFEFQHDIRLLPNDYISFFDNVNARAIKGQIIDNKFSNITELYSNVPKNSAMGGCIFGDNFVNICSGFSLPRTLENKSGPSVEEYSLINGQKTMQIKFLDANRYILYRINRGK